MCLREDQALLELVGESVGDVSTMPGTQSQSGNGEAMEEADRRHLYFAYGSNMDVDDLWMWCDRNRRPRVKYMKVLQASLEGYELCFNYYSHGRQGGAANIMPRRGKAVVGLLVEIGSDALTSIRLKEDWPETYDEIEVTVKTTENRTFEGVKTYRVVEAKQKSNHQPPTGYYLGLIIKNARRHGFPEAYIAYLESLETKA